MVSGFRVARVLLSYVEADGMDRTEMAAGQSVPKVASNPDANLGANYFREPRVQPAMSHEVEDETTVNESYSVTVPAAVRRAAGVDAGDKLRWHVDDDGTISVELVKQQYGAFSRLEAVDIGEPTDAAEDHDLVAGDS